MAPREDHRIVARGWQRSVVCLEAQAQFVERSRIPGGIRSGFLIAGRTGSIILGLAVRPR
jgi:hypothetical protein